MNERGPSKRLRFRAGEKETSGQVGPKLKKGGKLQKGIEKVKYFQRLRHDSDTTPSVDGEATSSNNPTTDKKTVGSNKQSEKSKNRMEQTAKDIGSAHQKLATQRPGKRSGLTKQLGRAAKIETWAYVHGNIREVEHENVGTESVHKTELAGETIVRGTNHYIKNRIRDKPLKRVRKLEMREVSTKANYAYRQLMQEHPELKRRAASRSFQKYRIKRQYAKQVREVAKHSKTVAKGANRISRTGVAFVKRNPKFLVIILLLFMVMLLMQSCVTSMLAIGNGVLGAISSTSYLAEDADIDEAELRYTEWETDLQLAINNAESTYPDYDEYRYDVQNISHNPYELMAFLTAVYDGFTYTGVQNILQQIFNEQYSLSFVEEIEVRYRIEMRTDLWWDGYGNLHSITYEVQVPYNHYILNINLAARSFTEVIFPRMTAGQLEQYNIYMTTKGNRQYLQSPFGNLNWLPYASSYYGYRVHPISGTKDYHKGVDIALPSGTEILAGHDGTVTFAGSSDDYGLVVVLDNGKDLVSKYAHCSNLLVADGQTVIAGQPIAKVGNTGKSTGAHLHLEIIKDGRYLNPLYYATTNDFSAGPTYSNNPGRAMGNGSFAALISEAEKHLGKPYVFGASGPNSFDCSSFACWVLTYSGVYNLSHTTAQGIYNQCTPISPGEAQPGDLIFFTGTYSTPNACSHVGIYVGGGMMIHAGNPVQYTNINTSYWQSHFYSFGRLH